MAPIAKRSRSSDAAAFRLIHQFCFWRAVARLCLVTRCRGGAEFSPTDDFIEFQVAGAEEEVNQVFGKGLGPDDRFLAPLRGAQKRCWVYPRALPHKR